MKQTLFTQLAQDVNNCHLCANMITPPHFTCPEYLENEKKILVQQALNEGKPADIVEKMVIGRLKKELTDLAAAIVAGRDIAADQVLSKHAEWVEELKKQYTFTAENALDIFLKETGKVFAAVLEDAGVYKNDEAGRAAFRKFAAAVNE